MNIADSGATAISAVGVCKDYGDRAVLRDLNLSIGWGEVAVLFGANGAGKTTLLRVLAGLARPDSGTIHIAGRPMGRTGSRARRLVGFAGHQTLLYNDLTCRENLVFYCQLYNIANHSQRVAQVLEQLDLSARSDRRVRTLSHGMQKRLALARAILHEPAVLLLDEPESGLDAWSVERLGSFLHDWSVSGKTALLTTHNAQIGLAWAGRLAGLVAGKIAYDAATSSRAATDIAALLGAVPGG